MLADIGKRRDCQRDLQMSGSMEIMADKLPFILSDYLLVYAVPILARVCVWYRVCISARVFYP